MILRKALSAKNRLAPINQIPPEILTLVATFFEKQRDLINATAVCQQWRATLLSFPRLWCNAGGNSSELEAYLERSNPIPIGVELSSPDLVSSIIPHTSRLKNLIVWVNNSPEFEKIANHLHHPIPTLCSLGISTENPNPCLLQLPPGVKEGLFLHLKTLHLYGIASFLGHQTFPNITELVLRTGRSSCSWTVSLLNTLQQLPGLVKVSILSQAGWFTETSPMFTVKLPRLREISLFTSDVTTQAFEGSIPPILRFLELPKVTSLIIESPFSPLPSTPILPASFFDKLLPNYIELPELHIETENGCGRLTFRSSSQALLTFHIGGLKDCGRELRLWGDLPISSIREVTAVRLGSECDDDAVWLAGILRRLGFLERLDLRGNCGQVLLHLRRQMMGSTAPAGIGTLIVRGGGYAESQAIEFEDIKDGVGLGETTVIYVPDPEALEEETDCWGSTEELALGKGDRRWWNDDWGSEGDYYESEDE